MKQNTNTDNTAGAVAQERLVRRCDTCHHFRLDAEKNGHKWGVCTWDSPVPDHYKKRDESKMSILSVACGSLAFGEECNAWQGFTPMEDNGAAEIARLRVCLADCEATLKTIHTWATFRCGEALNDRWSVAKLCKLVLNSLPNDKRLASADENLNNHEK
jgi:hypothetical protein